jgi:hypothetical protein
MKAFLVKYYSLHFLTLETRVSDPDSIRSVDPDPYLESGSGSRRAKITRKSRKIKKYHFLKCWMFSFES